MVSSLPLSRVRHKKNNRRKKILKGIFIGIPLFFIVSGVIIIAVLGWDMVKSTYNLGRAMTIHYVPEIPSKNMTGLYTKRPEPGEVIGQITIPTGSVNAAILHGTLDAQLKAGVGHYAGSTLPGEKGNVVLEGHRETVFNNLGEVKPGDLITVKTKFGSFIYKAAGIRIVDENDRTVIVRKDYEMLTLVTCYPIKSHQHSTQRYILTADFVRRDP